MQGSEREIVSQHVRERQGEATCRGVDFFFMSDHGRGELAGNMMCTDWNQPQESVWTNLLTEE